MLISSKATIQPQFSSRSLSISKKRKGISLSTEKENRKSNQNTSTLAFEPSQLSYRQKNINIDKFIIYDMDLQQWKSKRRQKNVHSQRRKGCEHNGKEVVMQPKVVYKPNNKENQWNIQAFNPYVTVNHMSQCKRRERTRAQQLRNRINQIQNRLNSLMIKNKV